MNKTGSKFAIVVSRFNATFTAKLLEGARQTLLQKGVALENIRVVEVPGAYEIPLAVKKLAVSLEFCAIIALGCVIRGETVHFDMICRSTLDSLQKISLETGIPVTSGILMAENVEQANARCGGRVGNRGAEAALAVLDMASLIKEIGA